MSTERLQNEPEDCYELFQTYLFMGFGRSVTELAQINGVSRQHIYNLMKKYSWIERLKNSRQKYSLAN